MKGKVENKVGIITWHYYSNFGSLLQAYALQQVLRNLGYDPLILNYHSKKFASTATYWKTPFRRVLGKMYRIRPLRPYLTTPHSSLLFREEFLNQTRMVKDEEALKRLTKNLDCLISGSDQIWAPNVFNPVYMLSFAKERQVRRISYGSSVGLTYIPDNLVPLYKELLSKYDAVSVREKTGKSLLLDRCGIESTVVLDPTLLLERSAYEKLESAPYEKIRTPYMFCYFLNENHSYREAVMNYAQKNNCQIIGVTMNKADHTWLKNITKTGPREFLWLVDNAETVFTDSYHGTIFSLLYHKNFYTFKRFEDGDSINQNSRIFQLDSWFDIGERIINDDNDFNEEKPYDFLRFELLLEQARYQSLGFLKEALN